MGRKNNNTPEIKYNKKKLKITFMCIKRLDVFSEKRRKPSPSSGGDIRKKPAGL
jgi:hypothetical protein